jgi:CC2D2A N-terminal C2 domain
MSNDNKTQRHKDKSKTRNVRKKQAVISTKKVETRKVRKISEKYLNDEIQVEKSLKLRHQGKPCEDDLAKQKQLEIDFFCDPFLSVPFGVDKVFKDSSSGVEGQYVDDDISHKSEAHSGRSNESPNTHLASTYVGPEHDAVVGKFELTRISYDEVDLLFRPKAEPIKSIPIDEERGLRIAREEGFFIPEPPTIAQSSNKLLLLNRLSESGATEFIDSSSDLKNFRKLNGDDIYRLRSDKKFTPIFVPPTPMTFDGLDKIISEKKFLKIFISHMTFDQHSLFSSEHLVARIVEKLYEEYEKRKKLDAVVSLRKKLNNLRRVKAETFPAPTDVPKSARTIRNEELTLNQQIKTVRKKLHDEEKYEHKLLKGLLENWKSLKNIRAQQSYAFTSLNLKIQKFDIDIDARQADWQQQYDAELNEMIAEEFDEYHMLKLKYKEFIKSVNDPESVAEDKAIVKKPKKPDIDKIVARLNEIYDKIPIDEPGLIIMSTKEEAEEKLTKPHEKLKKIGKIFYRFELEIDGEIVGSTKLCKLDEDFSILVQSAFILKLTKQLPDRIKIIVIHTSDMSLTFY